MIPVAPDPYADVYPELVGKLQPLMDRSVWTAPNPLIFMCNGNHEYFLVFFSSHAQLREFFESMGLELGKIEALHRITSINDAKKALEDCVLRLLRVTPIVDPHVDAEGRWTFQRLAAAPPADFSSADSIAVR